MNSNNPIEYLLAENEGKTLEFKENCSSLANIVRTAVAFANTAGGVLLVGVRDKTKEIVGLKSALDDEERLANTFADSIYPLLIPEIQIVSWRDRELVMVTVPHSVGPYYVKSEGLDRGVYVRLGSSNRRAGPEITDTIRQLTRNTFFDECPCPEINSEDIDFRAASELFSESGKTLSQAKIRSLGLQTNLGGKWVPTRGSVLLFGKNRASIFPHAQIRCARFNGTTSERFIDSLDIDEHLPTAVDTVITFVERNTRQHLEIGRLTRQETAEYPVQAVREAIINAVVHADYGIGGADIKVVIFDNRLEVTSPGFLPFGLTLEAALSGVSRLRNRVIARVFRELKLIEQWGTGLGRIISVCKTHNLQEPRFEELGTSFRVTLFSGRLLAENRPQWLAPLISHIMQSNEITTKDAASLWQTTDRTARTRLRKLVLQGILQEIGTNPKDPKKVYKLKKQ